MAEADGGDPDRDRLVYRPVFPRVLMAVLVAAESWATLASLVDGQYLQALGTGLWCLAVTAVLACFFWRPAVLVNGDGVELRNVLRDVRVPWSALEEVGTRFTLTLHVGDRRYQSWAGAAPGRPSPVGGFLGGPTSSSRGRSDHAVPDPRWTANRGSAAPAMSRDLRFDSGATAFMIEQRWNAWRESHSGTGTVGEPAPAVVSWSLMLPGAAVVAGVLACAVTWLPG